MLQNNENNIEAQQEIIPLLNPAAQPQQDAVQQPQVNALENLIRQRWVYFLSSGLSVLGLFFFSLATLQFKDRQEDAASTPIKISLLSSFSLAFLLVALGSSYRFYSLHQRVVLFQQQNPNQPQQPNNQVNPLEAALNDPDAHILNIQN